MEISIKSYILLGAIILTGLSAGLFYAWSVSVIPGTRKITDTSYLETMQSINRAIQNPAFFLIFFGSMVLLCTCTVYHFTESKIIFWLLLSSSILYFIGTLGVTVMGNVPLNNELDALNLGELTMDKIIQFRNYFETKWNQLHLIRTISSLISFLLVVLALLIQSKKI